MHRVTGEQEKRPFRLSIQPDAPVVNRDNAGPVFGSELEECVCIFVSGKRALTQLSDNSAFRLDEELGSPHIDLRWVLAGYIKEELVHGDCTLDEVECYTLDK